MRDYHLGLIFVILPVYLLLMYFMPLLVSGLTFIGILIWASAELERLPQRGWFMEISTKIGASFFFRTRARRALTLYLLIPVGVFITVVMLIWLLQGSL